MYSEDEDFDIFEDFEFCRKIKTYKTRSNPFEELDDCEFYSRYRFDKTTVEFLVESLNIGQPTTNRGLPIPVLLQVLITLHFFARNVHQSDLGALHGMSQTTVGKIIKDVSKRIASLLPHFINFPSSAEEYCETKRLFHKIARFPKVIGAIDFTHIRIKRPARNVGPIMAGHYLNRKGYYSLNVQIVTDSKCRIIDIVARSRGSIHDSNIWNNSRLKSSLEANISVHDGILLGDAGYSCSRILLTPVRNPSNVKDVHYNKSHTSTRSKIECLNGQIKSKFRSILDRLRVDLYTAKNVVVAVAVLHNIAKERNIVSFLEEEIGSPNPPQPNARHNAALECEDIAGRAFRDLFINQYF